MCMKRQVITIITTRVKKIKKPSATDRPKTGFVVVAVAFPTPPVPEFCITNVGTELDEINVHSIRIGVIMIT